MQHRVNLNRAQGAALKSTWRALELEERSTQALERRAGSLERRLERLRETIAARRARAENDQREAVNDVLQAELARRELKPVEPLAPEDLVWRQGRVVAVRLEDGLTEEQFEAAAAARAEAKLAADRASLEAEAKAREEKKHEAGELEKLGAELARKRAPVEPLKFTEAEIKTRLAEAKNGK